MQRTTETTNREDKGKKVTSYKKDPLREEFINKIMEGWKDTDPAKRTQRGQQ